MKFTSDKKLLIDDVYLCNFMYHSGSEDFMNACETMMKTVCMLYENQSNHRSRDDEILTHRLNCFKDELLESMSKQKIDTSEIVSSLRTDTLVHAMHNVTEQMNRVTHKVDTFSVSRNTTRFKCEEGEKGLHEVLENLLSPRDGYTILDTKTFAHSCDMVVKRTGYPDVRIESKAHGRETGESVRTQEVKRFESDLTHLNSHGVMVSLYSGICGKGAIEFELLPNKKFAFYLSRNEFDGGLLTEVIRLIYKLDTIVSDKDESDILTINHESIIKIKSHLNDFNRKIEDLKTNAKNSLRLLNELTLDVIERLLMSSDEQKTEKLKCNTCGHACKNKTGLTLHMKKCNTCVSV